MLSILMVDLFRRRGVHAALLIGIAPFLAFATNAVRCVGLVLNPKSNIATIHTLQGIAMLLASVLVLYAIDGLLQRLGTPGSEGPRKLRRSSEPRRISRSRVAVAGAGLALLVLLSLAVSPWRIANPASPLATDLIPQRVGAWRSADLQTDRLFLGMTGITGVVDRRYSRGMETVDVFAAAGTPRLRLRSFYSPKTAVPGSGWIVEEQSRTVVAGRDADVLVVRRGAERRLVYHWYQGTRGFGEEVVRDVLALDQTPWARHWRGSVVRLSTPLDALSPRAVSQKRLEGMVDLLDTALKALSQEPGEKEGPKERVFSFSPRVENRFHSVSAVDVRILLWIRAVEPRRVGGMLFAHRSGASHLV
jgi:EpsI family protein